MQNFPPVTQWLSCAMGHPPKKTSQNAPSISPSSARGIVPSPCLVTPPQHPTLSTAAGTRLIHHNVDSNPKRSLFVHMIGQDWMGLDVDPIWLSETLLRRNTCVQEFNWHTMPQNMLDICLEAFRCVLCELISNNNHDNNNTMSVDLPSLPPLPGLLHPLPHLATCPHSLPALSVLLIVQGM